MNPDKVQRLLISSYLLVLGVLTIFALQTWKRAAALESRILVLERKLKWVARIEAQVLRDGD